MNPLWTILIATLPQRADRFGRLLATLMPQVDRHHGRVTITALRNRGERPLGEVRQRLVETATSDYVSFVDDDDLVPEYFVNDVVTALTSVPEPPDYVGWRVQCYVDGEPLKPTFHSLEYSSWFDDAIGYYRDVSHLNPVRRELALYADFRRGEVPEDVSWATQLRPHVHSQVYVDRVMYHYFSSGGDSTWRGEGIDHSRLDRFDVVNPYFSYHPESST